MFSKILLTAALCIASLRLNCALANEKISNFETKAESEFSSSSESSSNNSSSPTNMLDNAHQTPNASLRGSITEKTSSEEEKVLSYVESFTFIRKNSYWPLPFSSEASIVATFGPIVNHETKEYEFHRGLDIEGLEGDLVVAVYSGTVYRITEDEAANGLKEVVLKHRFLDWTQVQADNYNTKSWYSIYSHIETDLKEGNNVVAGEEIGQLSATDDVPHLHFEVLVGTTCSLQNGIEDNCVTLGYDPHVHPLLVSEPISGPEFARPEMEVLTEIGPLKDGIIQISTPVAQPNINRYEIQVMGRGKKVKKSHILDLNLRKGFDATALSKLNGVDISKPYLQPDLLEEGDERWSMGVVIPSSWVESKSQGDWYRLVVQDIWGKSSYLSFTSEHKAWCRMETLNGIVQFTDEECTKMI